jgi:hypothetical protein
VVIWSRGDAELSGRVGGGELSQARGCEEFVHAVGGGPVVAVVEVEAAAGEHEGA